MLQIVFTFVIGLVGVGVFHVVDLPLPWLLGPITASLIAALSGVKLKSIKVLNESMRTVLGVAVGATITPAVLVTFPSMWPTLLMVPLMILAIGACGIPYFQRVWGYDFPTAYYATMPGGLQDMLLFGQEAGANVRALSLIHATRVLVIVVILPALLTLYWQADLSNPPGARADALPISELAIMVVCAIVGWLGAKKIGLFGASILGPMIITGAVTLAGLLHYRPPAEAIWAAQFFIGLTIGTNYAGITVAEVKRDLAAGFGFCGILIVLTVIFVETIYLADLAPGMEALLAFAPGGQAELTVLALIVGADVAFVVAHHVLRLILVITGAPIMMKLVSRDRASKPPD